MTEDTVTVVIADDQPMFLEGLRTALMATTGITIVAETSTGEEAIEMAAIHQADVVIMDVKMPGINGIDATRRIVGSSPHIGVLVLTMFHEDENVFQAMRAGARGYLLKGSDQAEIARAIRAVAAGDAIFGPALARRLIGYFATGRSSALPFAALTEREREVLELVARGCSNPDMARQLYLSPKTVRNHVSNIFAKLQVTDRAQASVRAREAGLGDPRTNAG